MVQPMSNKKPKSSSITKLDLYYSIVLRDEPNKIWGRISYLLENKINIGEKPRNYYRRCYRSPAYHSSTRLTTTTAEYTLNLRTYHTK